LQSFGRHTQRGFGFPREQPVPFSHKHHVDALGIDCRYRHTSVEKSSLLEAVESPVRKCLSSLRTPIRLRRRNPFAADCRLSKAQINHSQATDAEAVSTFACCSRELRPFHSLALFLRWTAGRRDVDIDSM
jgi:hypothetical protein